MIDIAYLFWQSLRPRLALEKHFKSQIIFSLPKRMDELEVILGYTRTGGRVV